MKNEIKNSMIKAGAAICAALAILLCSCAKPSPAQEEPIASAPAASEAPAQATAAPARVYEYAEEEIFYPARGTEVPAVVTVPEKEAGESMPLAVILHGHGGTNEGLAHIARALAEIGVAGIRMDFSGCGRSLEPFTKDNLTNMKADVIAAIDYMQSVYGTDPERIGLIGYSMGGRASLELVAEGGVSPYAMLLIAPASSTKDLKRLFGGDDTWDAMKAHAEDLGSAGYFTGYYTQELGAEFFRAIEAYDDPAPEAAKRFAGRALVVYADDDNVVRPEVSKSVAEALGCDTLRFNWGGHGYGLYDPPESELLSQVIESAVRLFGD